MATSSWRGPPTLWHGPTSAPCRPVSPGNLNCTRQGYGTMFWALRPRLLGSRLRMSPSQGEGYFLAPDRLHRLLRLRRLDLARWPCYPTGCLPAAAHLGFLAWAARACQAAQAATGCLGHLGRPGHLPGRSPGCSSTWPPARLHASDAREGWPPGRSGTAAVEPPPELPLPRRPAIGGKSAWLHARCGPVACPGCTFTRLESGGEGDLPYSPPVVHGERITMRNNRFARK